VTEADRAASLIVTRARVLEWRDAQVVAATLTLDALVAEQQAVTDARVRDVRWHRLLSDRGALVRQRLAEIADAVNAAVEALLREAAGTLGGAVGRAVPIEAVEPARLSAEHLGIANTPTSAVASALLPAVAMLREPWLWLSAGGQLHDLVRAALFDGAPGQPSVLVRYIRAIDRAAAAAMAGGDDAG